MAIVCHGFQICKRTIDRRCVMRILPRTSHSKIISKICLTQILARHRLPAVKRASTTAAATLTLSSEPLICNQSVRGLPRLSSYPTTRSRSSSRSNLATSQRGLATTIPPRTVGLIRTGCGSNPQSAIGPSCHKPPLHQRRSREGPVGPTLAISGPGNN